jgi:hypothetical protein
MHPKSIKVSLITGSVQKKKIRNRLSLSLLAVNEITLIGRPFSQSWLFCADVSHSEQNAALVLQSVRRTL